MLKTAYAETLGPPTIEPTTNMTFADLVDLFLELIYGSLIPLIIVVIFVVVAWKLIDMFIINVADEQARTNGKRTITIAVLALVVVLSIWGISALLRTSVFG